MATTISAATLTVTITESVTLNGSDQGASNVATYGSVNEVVKRIVSIPHDSETGILGMGAAISLSWTRFNRSSTRATWPAAWSTPWTPTPRR